MQTYAARIDASGYVSDVIVIPDGADAPTFCAELGLSGTWKAAPALVGIGFVEGDGGYYPEWVHVPGADAGPGGIENGYPEGYEVWHNGSAWVSRFSVNVNEPLADAPTTWSRVDGTYVTPAGWEYQIGEEVQEDGTWYRVKVATPFAPSAYPAGYDEIDGPGGDVVAPPAAAVWQAGVQYTIGDVVEYQGAQFECLQSHTSLAGWEPPNVPALWAAL